MGGKKANKVLRTKHFKYLQTYIPLQVEHHTTSIDHIKILIYERKKKTFSCYKPDSHLIYLPHYLFVPMKQ